ncbi:hypothetical protein AAFF_G00354860 [Aldrovandia affinis]|uniref:Uncharacterized protein n=1 Tax=Aldrovandia affinis TaxID=143900 RepID=A0AAD7SIN8_9TELE|nr:hypothetical protein AAFF_G00354860 [Aldrovandia affinis]
MTSIKRSSPRAIAEPQTSSLLPRWVATLVSGSGIELREVEEAIRELEERLGVRRLQKIGATETAVSAELQDPAVRQEMTPGRPDEASAVQPTHPAMASTSVPANTQLKLPRYSGAVQWEPYLAQLQLVARHCGWFTGRGSPIAAAKEERAGGPWPQTCGSTQGRATRRSAQRSGKSSHCTPSSRPLPRSECASTLSWPYPLMRPSRNPSSSVRNSLLCLKPVRPHSQRPPAQVRAHLPLFAMPLCRNLPHPLSRRQVLSVSCGDVAAAA